MEYHASQDSDWYMGRHVVNVDKPSTLEVCAEVYQSQTDQQHKRQTEGAAEC